MGRGERAAQTHCKRGHEFTPENTRWRSDRPGNRQCIECRKILNRRNYLRRRDA